MTVFCVTLVALGNGFHRIAQWQCGQGIRPRRVNCPEKKARQRGHCWYGRMEESRFNLNHVRRMKGLPGVNSIA